MSLSRPTMVMIGSRPSACSEVVRWSGLPRDVYCPEISTKSALFPRFGHKGNRSDHRTLIVVRPRNGGVGAQDAMGRRLPDRDAGAHTTARAAAEDGGLARRTSRRVQAALDRSDLYVADLCELPHAGGVKNLVGNA